MNSTPQTTTPWVSQITELMETYRSLITVRTVQHTSLGISIGILGVLSAALLLFVFLFTGVGFAWWLGEYLGSMKTGFFIMGGIYTAVLAVLVLMSRSVFMPWIRNYIIRKIYEQD